MTSSKRQNGYLNQRVIIFRLQYETYSLQMHPESPFRSVVAPTPNLSEQQYALRLIVVPYQYFPSLSPSFQPISSSPSSHISYVDVLHVFRRRIHPYCTASPPPCPSASVFAADLVFHSHFPTSPPRLRCYPHASMLRSSSHYLP